MTPEPAKSFEKEYKRCVAAKDRADGGVGGLSPQMGAEHPRAGGVEGERGLQQRDLRQIRAHEPLAGIERGRGDGGSFVRTSFG